MSRTPPPHPPPWNSGKTCLFHVFELLPVAPSSPPFTAASLLWMVCAYLRLILSRTKWIMLCACPFVSPFPIPLITSTLGTVTWHHRYWSCAPACWGKACLSSLYPLSHQVLGILLGKCLLFLFLTLFLPWYDLTGLLQYCSSWSPRHLHCSSSFIEMVFI